MEEEEGTRVIFYAIMVEDDIITVKHTYKTIHKEMVKYRRKLNVPPFKYVKKKDSDLIEVLRGKNYYLKQLEVIHVNSEEEIEERLYYWRNPQNWQK